jgi:hypothetical protein
LIAWDGLLMPHASECWQALSHGHAAEATVSGSDLVRTDFTDDSAWEQAAWRVPGMLGFSGYFYCAWVSARLG